jgi:glycosyltransferase involved in cell wall biosynthesis
LAKYLPENGFPTHVIASSEAGEAGLETVRNVPNKGTRTRRVLRQERLAMRIQRVLPYNERLPWCPHAVAAAEQLMQRLPVSAVVSTSPPLATHFSALWMKRKHGVKWVADFRDPLLGNPGRPRRWARSYDLFLQRQIFHHADALIAISDTIAEEWRARYPHWARKIHVIWNGFDPADGFGPKPLPPRTYQTLCHVGVLYALRHPVQLMAALARLAEAGRIDCARLRVRFTGPAQEVESFLRQPPVAALQEKGCFTLHNGLIPRAEAMNEIATSDFLLLIDINNLSNIGYTVPAKLFDYILTGRPILALTARNSPVERILQQSGLHVICLYHDDSEDALGRKLLDFLSLPTVPVQPSPWFLENFDGRRQAATFSGILKSL